jgi:hypothetical protein
MESVPFLGLDTNRRLVRHPLGPWVNTSDATQESHLTQFAVQGARHLAGSLPFVAEGHDLRFNDLAGPGTKATVGVIEVGGSKRKVLDC